MILVVLLSLIAPLSIDMVLPASKLIADQFGTQLVGVQDSLTSYLVAFALATFCHGALADAYGRRTVALWGLMLYTFGSLVCAASPSIQMLSLGRLLQGCSAGAGLVVGRAIVSDMFTGVEAKRHLAMISMMMCLPPAIAPVIGGWLSHVFGWRSNYIFLGALAIALASACFLTLRETLSPAARRPLHPKALSFTYTSILTDGRFLCLTGAAACLLAGQFVYIAGSAPILIDHYQRDETEFWRLFGPITLGVLLGGVAARHWLPLTREPRYMLVAFGITLAAAAADLGIANMGSEIRSWTFLPSFVYAFGMLLALPVMIGTYLAEKASMSGSVAAAQVFLQFMGLAMVSGIVVPLAAHSLTLMSMLKICFVLLACLLWLTRPGPKQIPQPFPR